ncbi:MAG: MoaD/ThiS family protein [Anaerolineae bacterium]|jgi:molybdopterin converting factor small subunit
MGVTFAIPAPYRRATGGNAEVQVEAGTVAQAIEALNRQYPDMAHRLLKDRENLNPFVSVYLNGERLQGPEALNRTVRDGDRLVVMPVIGGGN